MADSSGSEPPPPSYDEIVGNIPATAPVFVPQRDSDSLQRQIQRPTISDSPHSSDDEETAFLKSELRRLRDENSTLKKTDLRQAIEIERAYSMSSNNPVRPGATGQMGPLSSSIYQSPHASSFPQINVGGQRTTVHPVVSYNSQQGVTAHAVPTQPNAPVPGTSTDAEPYEDKKGSGCLQSCVIYGLVFGFILILIMFTVGARD